MFHLCEKIRIKTEAELLFCVSYFVIMNCCVFLSSTEIFIKFAKLLSSKKLQRIFCHGISPM